MTDKYPSQYLTRAVDEFSKLPGVGRRTALRFVLHLLRQPSSQVLRLGQATVDLAEKVQYCTCCHNISDTPLCPICADPQRDTSLVCVVENVREVMAIEATHQFHGLYHVLGGLISPMEGIGPQRLQIESLLKRVSDSRTLLPDTLPHPIEEVILALSTTMEGDATNFYIYKRLAAVPDLKITTLARGVSVGDEIEYADEVTLGRSLTYRTPFTDLFPASS